MSVTSSPLGKGSRTRLSPRKMVPSCILFLALLVATSSAGNVQRTTHLDHGDTPLSLRKLNETIGAIIPGVAPVIDSTPTLFSFFDDTPAPTTLSPTFKPTTAKPTPHPTREETPAPSPYPTKSATQGPTSRPTANPTSPPPSELPVAESPVAIPTAVVVDDVTHSPTATTGTASDFVEDGSESAPPTASPIKGPQTFTNSVPYLTTTFAGTDIAPMTPNEVMEWERITSQRVMDFWVLSTLVEDLLVATRLTGQTPPYTESGSATDTDVNYKKGDENNPALRRRDLQEASKLVLTFSQQIQYTIPASSSSSLNATTIVTQPFNTFSKRQEYKKMLLSADGLALNGLETVYIVDIYEPPPQPSAVDKGDSAGWMSYIIYGAIGAAGVLVLAIALACYCHSSGKAKQKQKSEQVALQKEAAAAKKAAESGLMPPPGLKPGMDARVQSIIEVENRDDDISTLGDPLGPYDKNWMARRNQSSDERSVNENTVGPSIIHDFDYTKTFGGKFDMTSNSSTADTAISKSRASAAQGGPSALGPAHSGDDEYSFDEAFAAPSDFNAQQERQRIEIKAPPGKLGVVIDTFDNGQPGVNAIRGDSVLKDDLCVGDLLVEFDGQDTSNMTALEVSRMIGARSGNGVRRLVFVRYK